MVVEGDGRVDDALGRVEGYGEDVVVLHGDSLKQVLVIQVAKEVFGENMAWTGPRSAAGVLKFPHFNRSFFNTRMTRHCGSSGGTLKCRARLHRLESQPD